MFFRSYGSRETQLSIWYSLQRRCIGGTSESGDYCLSRVNEVRPLPGDISSVIFGLRMLDEHKAIIRKNTADLPNMKYRQATNGEEFRLHILHL